MIDYSTPIKTKSNKVPLSCKVFAGVVYIAFSSALVYAIFGGF